MRLLDAETFQFRDFDPSAVPPYAILSHTWGQEEITFEDVATDFGEHVKRKLGWKKINGTCREALDDKLNWVWVDTCCIDKRSSAELSEAINSMYAWYRQAAVCYVHLTDVESQEDQNITQLASARWFTRGWTLQELLAPHLLEFFATDWINIGRIEKAKEDDGVLPSTLLHEPSSRGRGDISGEVAGITGIGLDVLTGQRPLESVCVAQRMSWASSRRTTRPEDISYCLLGIFGINMPTIYGEGNKAFQRLQEEIVKSSDDHSLFAWTMPAATPWEPYGLLASSPASFANSKDVSAFRDWTDTSPYSIGNLGLAITLPVHTISPSEYRAFLNCTWSDPERYRVCLALRRIPGTVNQYQRVRVGERRVGQGVDSQSFSRTQIYLRQAQILPSASDVIEKRPLQISLPTLGLHGSSTRMLSSFLHTDVAVASEDWFAALMRQEVSANSETVKSLFFLPGQRATLSVALCFEEIPERDNDKNAPGTTRAISSIKLRDMRDMRKRQCLSGSRWQQLKKGIKSARRPAPEDTAQDRRFLVLIGTAHDSHSPVCIPLGIREYVERLDRVLDSKSEQEWARRQKCRELFEDLSDEFRTLAWAHSIHPDRNVRADVDEVSMNLFNESPGHPLECELEIKRMERTELDGTMIVAELDSRPVDRIAVRRAQEAEEAAHITSQQATQEHERESRNTNRDSWIQWHGVSPARVLHDNVFELQEDRANEDEPVSPLTPTDDEPAVGLPSIGVA